MAVARKWKVVAGAATVALALGAGTAIAQTTNDGPSDTGTDVTHEDSVDTGDSVDSVDSGDSAGSPDSPDAP